MGPASESRKKRIREQSNQYIIASQLGGIDSHRRAYTPDALSETEKKDKGEREIEGSRDSRRARDRNKRVSSFPLPSSHVKFIEGDADAQCSPHSGSRGGRFKTTRCSRLFLSPPLSFPSRLCSRGIAHVHSPFPPTMACKCDIAR